MCCFFFLKRVKPVSVHNKTPTLGSKIYLLIPGRVCVVPGVRPSSQHLLLLSLHVFEKVLELVLSVKSVDTFQAGARSLAGFHNSLTA